MSDQAKMGLTWASPQQQARNAAQPEPEPVADKYLMEIECTKCGAKQDGILTVNAPPQQQDLPSPHNRLVQFAREVLADFPHSMPDGFDLQDLAIKHSLLIGREVTEPCGNECHCAEYNGAEQMLDGVTCYHRHPMLREKNQ